MKYCPSCGTQYTDDTLRFCLQDGSQLDDIREAEIPTVVLNETPTITRNRVPSRSYETNPDGTERISYERDEKKRSLVVPIAIAVIGAAALFIAGAVATWTYLSRPMIDNGNKAPGTETSPSKPNVAETPTKRVSPTPSSSASMAPTASRTPPPIDRAQGEREIANMIDRWGAEAENMDLDGYMDNYAARVDYYNRKGVDIAYVRKDKGRAFRMYSSIGIETSNLKVSFDENGDNATAEFDKLWDFRGARNSSGKVRTELRLRMDAGRWVITGERDIKVYYINR
jgi:hypothetical protein